MLGLPSTTEVNKRLPKEAFYRNLKVNSKIRDSFTHDVERITVRNSVQEATANIPAGKDVKEILVLEVELKDAKVPTDALKLIASNNPHKLLFVCSNDGNGCMCVYVGKLVVGDWRSLDALKLILNADSLDSLWDTLASQIVFNDIGNKDTTVEQRLRDKEKIEALRKKRDSIEARCRKERQFAKKNKLLEQLKEVNRELELLGKGNQAR